MKKLFWFSKINTKDSFSRIAESLLPLIKENNYTLYTIVPPKLNVSNLIGLFDEKNILKMGDDIKSSFGLTFDEFNHRFPKNLGSDMKYTMLQTLTFCRDNEVDVLLITMGVYEANWFMDIIEQLKNLTTIKILDNKITKIIMYTPFDYIPSYETIKHLIKADCIITTMPDSCENLQMLCTIGNALHAHDNNVQKTQKSHVPKIDWVGHGVDPAFYKIDRNEAIDYLNKQTKENSFFITNKLINRNDIIILNANLVGPRKRLDETIKAFNEIKKTYNNIPIKLWLHSHNKELVKYIEYKDDIILSTRRITNEELNYVYNTCQIGIQTSWGEGWSLTNCEHALVGGLQVVPDFLACGFHFKDNRGILIPIDKLKTINEAKTEVTIGLVNTKDTTYALKKAIKKIINNEYNPTATIEYINTYTWNSACEKLLNIIN
jgi:glycosyltransferase involved in cell wall biosynthesis